MPATQETPAVYSGFDRMPIAGEYRRGGAGQTATDTDPYSGDTLLELELASGDDVDAACRAARRAQPEWAQTQPAARAAGEPETDAYLEQLNTLQQPS